MSCSLRASGSRAATCSLTPAMSTRGSSRSESHNRRRLAEAQERLREQERVLERLRSDPAYVDKVIRKKLGYAEPDEFIYRFEE